MTLEFTPEKTRIGWIGTGVMGSSMCGHLVAAGYKASVYNRSAEKAKALVEKGAKLLDSPRAVAQASDVVFMIVGYPKDVREVVLGENGVLGGARAGAVLVDMTTSEPALAVEIDQAAKAKGVHSVDAPVSGGDVGAREARLSIMVGGEKPVFDALAPLFEKMGKTIVYQGPAGSGQHTKMVNQILIATNMIGVCEALLYAYKAGLDLNVVLQSVSYRGRGILEPEQSGSPCDRGQFRAGILRRAFPERHGDRLGGSAADEALLAGLGPFRATLSCRRSTRICSQGDARTVAGACANFGC